VRHPVEVARSLEGLHDLSLPLGCLMWLRHVLDAERATRGHPRVFVHYHELLSEPNLIAARVGPLLAAGPRGAPEAGEVAAWIDPALRHHVARQEQLLQPGSFYPWLRAVYEAHVMLVGDPTDMAAQRQLDAVRAAFDAATEPLASLFEAGEQRAAEQEARIAALERDAAAATADAAVLREALESRGSALKEYDLQIASLGRELVECEARLASCFAASAMKLAERDGRIAMLDRDLAAAKAEAAILQGRLDARNESLAERDLRISHLDREVSDREAGLASCEATIRTLQASLSWRITLPLRAAGRLFGRL
jgi:hypothetical protein